MSRRHADLPQSRGAAATRGDHRFDRRVDAVPAIHETGDAGVGHARPLLHTISGKTDGGAVPECHDDRGARRKDVCCLGQPFGSGRRDRDGWRAEWRGAALSTPVQVVRRQAGLAVLVLVAILVAPRASADNALSALVDALAERLEIAEPVAAFKWSAHGDIEDPAHVEQELVTLREDAASGQIDPDYVVRVFGDQINATEAIEYRRFADWKLDPGGVPPAPADLSASRAAIDTLNAKILSHIALN